MKKTKEIVLYDDTENYKKFDETRDFLFAVYADENGWACKENIPDETVYKEIDFQNAETWRDLKDALENSFKTRYYLMTGTCGRWNGNFEGGTFITCYRDFQSMIQHLDNIKVIDRNGHLIKYAVDKHTIDRCTASDNVSKFLHGRIWIINYRELEKEIERRVEEGSEKKREKL